MPGTESKSYGASPHPTSEHPYRAAFCDADGHVYVAHFRNIKDIERFARREYIYDVGVTVKFIVYNLASR